MTWDGLLKKRGLALALAWLLASLQPLTAQTVIGGADPDPSAVLDLQSASRGMMPPRMSAAQRDSIYKPQTGLLIYNTTLNCVEVNTGTQLAPQWRCVVPIPPGSIGSLNCAGATTTGSLANLATTGVTANVPYTGGDGGTHKGQTVTSTGVTGLTATLQPGVFAYGSETLTYTITGSPSGVGTASFALNIGGKTCTLTLTLLAGYISTLGCDQAVLNDTLIAGAAATGVSVSVPYTGGTGGSYGAQTLSSTGLTGLTASLAAGSFANGSGTFLYTITGTPADTGTANFALNIGGQSCTLSLTVVPGSIGSLNCAGANITGTFVVGVAASGASASLPYTGGDGGKHSGQTVSSTGVTGLTATLAAGSFAKGSGSLSYSITGTPQDTGMASFALDIGGQTCTLTLTVAPGAISSLSCANAVQVNNLVIGVNAAGVVAKVPYTGGNGGLHNGQVASSTGVTGLTATLSPGLFASGNDTLLYEISGTPADTGTASFALDIGGQSCNLELDVLPGAIDSLLCDSALLIGTLESGLAASGVSVRVPYTGGNGGPHNGQTVTSTGVTGLTATLAAGNFANGSDSLTYVISGTAASFGNALFALSIGGKSCSLSVEVLNRCYAKISPTETKAFMCHNLAAANTAADPFTPSWEIIGGYWQWGRKGPSAPQWLNTNTANFAHGPTGAGAGQTNEAAVSGWNQYSFPNTNDWTDNVKTSNDPCPQDFRVPTISQLMGLRDHNTKTFVGTWPGISGSPTNYSCGFRYGDRLFLPSAGYRDAANGSLQSRGGGGFYWSSTAGVSLQTSFAMYFYAHTNYNPDPGPQNRGYSIRCIAE